MTIKYEELANIMLDESTVYVSEEGIKLKDPDFYKRLFAVYDKDEKEMYWWLNKIAAERLIGAIDLDKNMRKTNE